MLTAAGRVRLASAALIVITAACSWINRAFDAETPRLPVAEELLPGLEECNATQALVVSGRVTRNELNEFGTQLCDYELTITNFREDARVIPVLRVHRLDGYQNLDEHEWAPQGSLVRLASTEWSGNVYTYTDPDANGPVAVVADRIAGVYHSDGCASLTEDSATLELYSVPLGPAPCPLGTGQ